jgi:four helix bundle protein
LDSTWNDALSIQRSDDCPRVSDFRKLLVWQKAHALALHVDRAAVTIRAARYAALRGQLIRAAMSIPANIAEGRRQGSDRDFARFLRYAVNSACELEYHLQVVRDIGALPESVCDELIAELIEVRRMLHGLLNKLKDDAPTAPPKRHSPTTTPKIPQNEAEELTS